MSEKFSCTITIEEKPDREKLGSDLMNNFLLPLAEMVERHQVGELRSIFCPNDRDTIIEVEYSLQATLWPRPRTKPLYAAHIKTDGRVALLQRYTGRTYPTERTPLKKFLVDLGEFFKEAFAEKATHYAEAEAIRTVMEETMGRLRSIKATAHYER